MAREYGRGALVTVTHALVTPNWEYLVDHLKDLTGLEHKSMSTVVMDIPHHALLLQFTPFR